MATAYRVQLDDLDLHQILDDLKTRAESWERTADYLGTNKMRDAEFFLLEECGSQEEANEIANHYRSIIDKIRSQMDEQELNDTKSTR